MSNINYLIVDGVVKSTYNINSKNIFPFRDNTKSPDNYHVCNKLYNNGNVKQILKTVQGVIVLYNSGDVYVIGNNVYGELGVLENKNELTKLEDIPSISKIVTNGINTLMMATDGDLYACGKNEHGELGLGHYNSVKTITRVNEIIGCIDLDISRTGGFSAIIMNDRKEVYFSGNNKKGVFGRGSDTNTSDKYCYFIKSYYAPTIIHKVYCAEKNVIILDNDKKIYLSGAESPINPFNMDCYKFIQIPSIEDVKKFTCINSEQAFIILNNGLCYGIGLNDKLDNSQTSGLGKLGMDISTPKLSRFTLIYNINSFASYNVVDIECNYDVNNRFGGIIFVSQLAKLGIISTLNSKLGCSDISLNKINTDNMIYLK